MSDTTSYAAREFGGRFGRHVSIYGVGSVGMAFIAAAAVAAQTRIINPGQVGRLGVLLTFAAGLIVLYDLGILTGTARAVIGAPGDETADRERSETSVDPREAMTTGVVMNVILAAFGTVVVVLLRHPLAGLLLHQSSESGLVVLAGLVGAVGSVLRLCVNVTRYERRPVIYASMQVARPGFALAGAVAMLVLVAPTVHSVLIGTLAGEGLALAFTLLLTRRLYRACVSRRAAKLVWAVGHRWVPDTVALWTLNATDVFVLASYANNATVGIYKTAASIAVLMGHLTTILFIAWGPLTRDPIFRAAADDLGDRYLRRIFTTYFMITTISALFLVAIFQDQLIGIAGPKFASGARIIPLVALGTVLYGVLRITYVGSDAKHKVGYFQVLPVISLVVYLALAVLVAPSLGIYGPPMARGTAYAVGWIGFMIFIAASRSTVPFDWKRVTLTSLVAGALLAAERLAPTHGGGPRLAFQFAAVAIFALVVVGTRIVPFDHLRGLLIIIRRAVPSRAGPLHLSSEMQSVDPATRSMLFELVRDRDSPAEVAARRGVSEDEVRMEFVATVRQLAHAGPASVPDADLSYYLLWRGTTSSRDRMARRLADEGVDMVDLDSMRLTVDRLRRGRSETLIRLLSPDAERWSTERVWRGRLAGMEPAELQRFRWILQDEIAERPRIDATRPDGDPLAWSAARVRWLVGADASCVDDHVLGRSLLARGASRERAAEAEQLVAAGVRSEELQEMVDAVDWMRLMSTRQWQALARSRPEDFAVSTAALHHGRDSGPREPLLDDFQSVVDGDTFDLDMP